jgi:protease-4
VALPLLLLRRLLWRARPNTFLLVEIDGAVEEIPPALRWWPPRRRPVVSLHDLREAVDASARDPRIAGLLVVLKSMRGAGFATAASIRSVLERARAAGKTVVVALPLGAGTRETFVAMAADRVLLGPAATLAPLGLLASARYIRGALDRAGIVPEVHARGRYKTAGERIESKAMSDAEREQVEALLDRIYAEVVRAIATGREVGEEKAREAIDRAPYMGDEAIAARLVDDLAYEDEIPQRLGRGDKPAPVRSAQSYLAAHMPLHPAALRSPGVIAVVRVHGVIAGGVELPLRRVAVDERIIFALRMARVNPLVRGVILHVDSPGGSALASDRIHHELVRLASRKPLVACMANVAASGGYYVAAAAHEIVAQPTTVTGSIGVVAARFVMAPLLERLGVATQVLQRGAHARLLDPFLPLGEHERAALDRELEHVYRAFLGVVAKGRGRSIEEIERVAQGRVWTGADAHAHGLVDRLGGFEEALESLRVRIGRRAELMPVVVLRPRLRPTSTADAFETQSAALVAALLGVTADEVETVAAVLALRRERVLALAGAATKLTAMLT